jgi:hypothetical protein
MFYNIVKLLIFSNNYIIRYFDIFYNNGLNWIQM